MLGGFSKKAYFTTDLEFWMRISMHYDVIYLAMPLVEYRMYHKDGWTSSQYTIKIDGATYSNLKGLQDEYTTRKIILQKTKLILSNWKNIDRSVRKRMIGSVNRVVENNYLLYGKKGEALKALYQVCKDFPDLLLDISMTKLFLKFLMGHRMTGYLKGILMTRRDYKKDKS